MSFSTFLVFSNFFSICFFFFSSSFYFFNFRTLNLFLAIICLANACNLKVAISYIILKFTIFIARYFLKYFCIISALSFFYFISFSYLTLRLALNLLKDFYTVITWSCIFLLNRTAYYFSIANIFLFTNFYISN